MSVAGAATAPRRTVLISGATKGIGRALTERLAAAGHDVIGLARSEAPGFPGELVRVDMSDRAACTRVLAEIARTKAVDAVVNNVGMVRPQALGEIKVADLDLVFDINVRTAVETTQAFVAGMRDRGWGRIVNISSLTVLGTPGRTAYASAKAALITATRVWALELARHGVTVNAVAPGPTETGLFRQSNPPGSPGEARYLAMVPMARIGRPAEIAAVIAFLLSEEASFVTGQTIFADGGASVGRLLL